MTFWPISRVAHPMANLVEHNILFLLHSRQWSLHAGYQAICDVTEHDMTPTQLVISAFKPAHPTARRGKLLVASLRDSRAVFCRNVSLVGDGVATRANNQPCLGKRRETNPISRVDYLTPGNEFALKNCTDAWRCCLMVDWILRIMPQGSMK